MKRKNQLLILFIFLTTFCYSITAQNNQIECYKIFNQIERMLIEKDTSTAMFLYESIGENKCILKKGRYFRFSVIYYNLGKHEKSKQHVRTAVENGFLGALHFDQEFDGLLEIINKKYGDDFLQEILALNKQLVTEKIEKHGHLVHELKEIYETDQALRKDKKYKECKRYNFSRRLGFPYDSTQNHREMMACFEEFKQKDSTLLQRFVDITDSLGHVPGDDIIFGMFPINPIVNHTAHFDYPNLDSLYLRSVWDGTMSPEVYAWYQGYHEEYFKEDHQFYFTHAEQIFSDLPVEEIEAIDRRRRNIGLPPCPAVIWNVRRYE